MGLTSLHQVKYLSLIKIMENQQKLHYCEAHVSTNYVGAIFKKQQEISTHDK